MGPGLKIATIQIINNSHTLITIYIQKWSLHHDLI